MENRTKLLEVAKQNLGKDLVPYEDTLACAGSVNALFLKAFGKEIGGGLSTYRMYLCLQTDPRFQKVPEGLPGDVVISPTGAGDSKKIRNGHVGIVMENGNIASNNSLNGLFEINYTFETWKRRWKDYGRYPMDYFRVYTPYVPAPVAVEPPKPLIPVAPEPATTLMPLWMRFLLDRSLGSREPALGGQRNSGWAKASKEHINRIGVSELSGKKGTFLNPLVCHHIDPVHKNPAREMDSTNWVVLTTWEHLVIAHLGSWQSWNPTLLEDIKIWKKKYDDRP